MYVSPKPGKTGGDSNHLCYDSALLNSN